MGRDRRMNITNRYDKMNHLACEVEHSLSILFFEEDWIVVKSLQEQLVDGVQVTRCVMSSRVSESDVGTQSVVLFHRPDLDLPHFSISPLRGDHFLDRLRMRVGSIRFTDPPQFSPSFDVTGWAEEAIGVLITPELRELLTSRLNYELRGIGTSVALIFLNKVVPPESADEFAADAVQIVRFLAEGERQLDSRPKVRRDASGEDSYKVAKRMGWGFQKRFQLERLTLEELNQFVATPSPRAIPQGMKRQVLYKESMWMFLVLFGGFLLVTVAWSHQSDLTIASGQVLGTVIALAGFFGLYFTLRARKRKLVALRDGELVEGRIRRVERSGHTINSRRVYHVFLEFERTGLEPQRTSVFTLHEEKRDLNSLIFNGKRT